MHVFPFGYNVRDNLPEVCPFFLHRRNAVMKGLIPTLKSDFHSCVILHLPAFRHSAITVLRQVNANPPPNPPEWLRLAPLTLTITIRNPNLSPKPSLFSFVGA